MPFSETELIKKYLSRARSKILVDVGAHQGSFSEVFARDGWQIIAFEPESHNYEVLQRTMSGYDTVTIIKKAISDAANSCQPFFVSKEHFGIHSLKPFHDTHELAYEVEVVRLDDALLELNITDVTLLKIDIEGADFLALKGFNYNQYSPELIMAEFMDDRSARNFGYTHHDMVHFMKQKGYAAFVSEWDVVKEYGREDKPGEPHVWLQCLPYPLDHEPAWGNLIFVPEKKSDCFAQTLVSYLRCLTIYEKTEILRQNIRKIPGATTFYRKLKRLR